MIKVVTDHRVEKFVNSLNDRDRAKCFEYIELFEKHGFSMGSQYLKKVRGSVWELRPGRVRLFLFVKSEKQVIIHAVIKSSQKIRQQDWQVIQARTKEYSI